jgi:nucleotide-binding universal stress UspA family protein
LMLIAPTSKRGEEIMSKGFLLVPIDFEQGSVRALELARELASGLGAEIAIVHVYQLPVLAYPGFEPAAALPIMTEVAVAARRAIDDFATQHGITEVSLREGDASTEILAAAAEIGAKMIVMGTHGRRGLARALLGSVTERVVRQSPIPVVTVRAPQAS